MKKPSVLLAILALTSAMTASAHASDKETPPKRPATPAECDPSSWVVDPGVDYSICEEGSTRRQ